MEEYKKVRYAKFLGEDVRIVDFENIEYVVVKDLFNSLNKLVSDGKGGLKVNNDDLYKLKLMFGEESIKKIPIKIDKTKDNRIRCTQIVNATPFNLILKRKDEFMIAFDKNGIRPIEFREEYTFVKNVKKFFKNSNVNIQTQYPIMEYRVDLTIGSRIFVEFDENHHKYQIEEDMKRMDNICKSTLISEVNGELIIDKFGDELDDFPFDVKKYDGYTIYEGAVSSFIRVTDKNCLSWIPYVYSFYEDCEETMGDIYEQPKNFIDSSLKLNDLKVRY